MTAPLVLYLTCFALTFGALALLPFVRRRRAGTSLRLALEPLMVRAIVMLVPPALMSMGGGVSYGMVAPAALALLFGVTQWVLLGQGGAALARRGHMPGWLGAASALLILIGLSIASSTSYLFATTWLLPPLTVVLAVWRARRVALRPTPTCAQPRTAPVGNHSSPEV